MKEQCKGQFDSWQPGYPAFFHRERVLVIRNSFELGIVDVVSNTVKTHNIAINAIKKAGGYE